MKQACGITQGSESFNADKGINLIKIFSLEVLMCHEIGDLGRILKLKQSIESILNDDNFGVFDYEPQAMGLIYEASAGKLMNEWLWKQAAAAF
jgi:hypothetical protein